ncbi:MULTISPECIES: hypothetical protein [unclassified Microcoleus]|uniref:hypothetical protein n=1 Tax=unclassified Microcoleus TaxID=2642155 RepID=UPI002FCF8D87
MITENPLLLLDKLSKHPRGLELAYLVYQLHQDSQGHTQSEPRLVAIALNLAKRQGIKDRPYFKGMANKEIRKWIDQHSPKPEIT